MLRNRNNAASKLSVTVACCGSAVALLILLVGYVENAKTHMSNLRNTAEPVNQTVVIQAMPNELFSWYSIPMSEFHEEFYRILHQIPENVEIVYIESVDSNQ